jgi:hypothetical protein
MSPNLDKMALKLGVKPYKIKEHNLQYYYTKWPQLCCKYNLKPISDNIGPFEFNKAISVLDNYYRDIGSDYYRNLVKECLKYKDGESLLGQPTNETLDHMIGEYIRFRPKTHILTLWPNAQDRLNDLLEILHENGHVYYIKKINLHYDAAKNLIYQLYSDTHRLSDIAKIEEKLEYIGWKKGEVMTIKIIFFDHQSELAISGSVRPLKTMIRDVWIKGTDLRGDDFVHINDSFYQTYEYSKIYLNKNSLVALHYQDLKHHLSDDLKNGRIYTNTIKKWIVENVEPIDYDRIIFMGSVGLYAYGIRACRDVDGLVSGHPVSVDSQTNGLKEKLHKSFYNYKTKFFFADVGMQGTEMWKEEWNTKDLPWYNLMGIRHIDELIFDPQHYFYFNGIKMISLLNNVRKRVLRKKVSDIGDLLEIERKTNISIDYPSVTDYTKEDFIEKLTLYMGNRYSDNDTYMDKVNTFNYKN